MAELIVYMPDHVSGDRDPADVRGEIIGNLVRCKDCKFWNNNGIITKCEKHIGNGYPGDWFCADGKRKDTK